MSKCIPDFSIMKISDEQCGALGTEKDFFFFVDVLQNILSDCVVV